jgi:hypothetical protein
MECEKGLDALTAKFMALSPELKQKMKPHMGIYKESAIAFDEQRKLEAGTPDDIALDAETQRVVDSMNEIQNLTQLEASKESFDMSNPSIREAYDKTVKLLSE